MRLRDDEIRMLRFLQDRNPISITFARAESILRKFRYHGLIEDADALTERGFHVASKLPAEPEPDEQIDLIEFHDNEKEQEPHGIV